MRSPPALTILLILTFACAGADRAPVQGAPRGPIAYRIDAPGGGTATLFGSIHVARSSDWGLSPALEAALEGSEVLVLEIDLRHLSPLEIARDMLGLGILPPGQHLRETVSAETWKTLESRASELELPLETLDRLKPWFVALQFVAAALAEAGFDPEHGVEQILLEAAPTKPVRALETPRDQFAIFDRLPYRLQDRMLQDALAPAETESALLEALVDAWQIGDVDSLEAILFEDRDDPEMAPFYENTYILRNHRMAQGIRKILAETRTAFVVIGAAHLLGEESVPELLTEAGLRLRRLDVR